MPKITVCKLFGGYGIIKVGDEIIPFFIALKKHP